VFVGADFSVDAADRRELVALVLQELDVKYLFPEVAAQNRPVLAKRWSDQALQTMTSARQIMQKMNADLLELFEDKHVFLKAARDIPEAMLHEQAAPTPEDLARMATFEENGHFGIARADIMEGGIGYLELDHFPYVNVPGMERAAANGVAAIADTRALIIDLRRNAGGDGDTVTLFMSYLLDDKTLLSESYDRSGKTSSEWTRAEIRGRRYGASRPLFVLTSRRTFSAGEAFAYAVQTLKRGTIIGETTGGGGHYNRFVKVGKHFVLSVAIGTTKSPVTHTNWDGIGVKPDVETSADRALDVALDRARTAVGGQPAIR
jgi:hypothetical protein